MKERLNNLLSEVGESFDAPLAAMYATWAASLSELEDLIESYRAFAVALTPPTPDERAALRKLLKRTLKVVGPAPEEPDSVPPLSASARASETPAIRQVETPTMI